MATANEVRSVRLFRSDGIAPGSGATVCATLTDPDVPARGVSGHLHRFAMIHRVEDAKRPATRVKRLAGFVVMLKRGEALHPRSKT